MQNEFYPELLKSIKEKIEGEATAKTEVATDLQSKFKSRDLTESVQKSELT